MKRKALTFLTVALLISLTACGNKDKEQSKPTPTVNDNNVTATEVEPTPDVIEETTEKETVTEVEETVTTIELNSNIEKSAYIMDKLYADEKDNILFSPMSLNMALGMIENGATGSSKELLDDYLGTPNFNKTAKSIMDRYYKEGEVINPSEEAYSQSVKWFKEYGLDNTSADHLARALVSDYLDGFDGYQYWDEMREFEDSLYDSDLEVFRDFKSSIGEYCYNNIYGDNSLFNVANSIWVSNKRTIVPSFKEDLTNIYKADVDTIDIDDPVISAKKINDWTSKKTHELIKEIVDESHITPNTSAILVNTIYFNSNWVEDWHAKPGSFVDANNNKKEIESIRNEVREYFEDDEATAFGMYYKNGFEFIGILPKNTGDFNVSDIDIDKLLNSNKTEEYDEIYAEMPRLKYETNNKVLTKSLKELGLNELFTPDAHFENVVEIGPDEYTYISDVIQKCTIDLDEYGTEASAATAIVMKTDSMAIAFEEPKIAEVILDRPFMYLIIDRETNQIAFLGKVVNAE